MTILTEEQLRKLPTKRLLVYKRKYLPSPNYPCGVSDYVWDCECNQCTEIKDLVEQYEHHYAIIKKVLDEREHVEQ